MSELTISDFKPGMRVRVKEEEHPACGHSSIVRKTVKTASRGTMFVQTNPITENEFEYFLPWELEIIES